MYYVYVLPMCAICVCIKLLYLCTSLRICEIMKIYQEIRKKMLKASKQIPISLCQSG